ncbi:MAG: hypothetical protein NTX72_01540 [Candidatus Uhrbacteria bacterium]|nr:hypothetical protein [Candidatus Uhrbacteria bacterium]
MVAVKPVDLSRVVPSAAFWVIGICGTIAIFSTSWCKEAPKTAGSLSASAVAKEAPTPTSQPARAAAVAPAMFGELKVQPGPCEVFPGTIQTIANICDDGNGSFFIRLNPSDDPNLRMAYLMERLRSFRLDLQDRRILSVTPVTDTICIDNVCMPHVFGAFGRYEYILK